MNKYYLYRHIRLDNNIPFYIGIGTKNNRNHPNIFSEYCRAYSKTDRCTFWKNIINKTNYRVEILLESNDYEFIKRKEIEFIALYGRRNLKLGPLVNLTNGGDGSNGYIPSEITRKNHSIRMTGRIQSEEEKIKRNKSREGYNHSEETKKKISEAHKGKPINIEHYNKLLQGQILSNSKSVLQYDPYGNFIREWISATEATKHMKVNMTAIRHCVQGKVNRAGGFIWKEKTNPIPSKVEVPREQRRRVKLIDIITEEEVIFETAKSCAEYVGMNKADFNRLFDGGKIYKKRYTIKNLLPSQISYK
jgi:hypothetical protein